VCLLEDETGSFGDDIANLQNPGTIAAIFDGVRAGSADSQFAVAGFRDYNVSPHGSSGDWVYRLTSSMSAEFTDWESGVNALTAGGGADTPEAQYDAIVAAATGPTNYPDSIEGPQDDCGWRADPDVTRVLVVTTDAPFHLPGDGKPHVNTEATTIATLAAEGITVIGLKAPGSGGELDALAAATGGSVQPLSSDGSNIAAAILAGLSNLPIEVSLASDCSLPITTSFVPGIDTVTSGDDAYFVETIAVSAGAAGGTYTCADQVFYDGDEAEGLIESKTIHVPGIELTPELAENELTAGAEHTVTATVTAGNVGPLEGIRVEFELATGPNAVVTAVGFTDENGEVTFTWVPGDISPDFLGVDTVTASFTDGEGMVTYGFDTAFKEWVDTTPPLAACLESVNPHGQTKPKAPGNGGQGQNQDGFYELYGEDEVWPEDALDFYLVDDGSGVVFGPFAIGTVFKWTEDDEAVPTIKTMGGTNSAVDWHIIANGDALVLVIDGSGNVSDPAACLVPPPPK
jgi:hypothetical protein